MSNGWIKLHRKLKESPLYKDCNSKQRDILINILLSVNHKPNKWIYKGEEVEVQAGQMITSLESIAKMCADDVTSRMVRTALLKFEKYGFLTNQSSNKNRLITIANWESYQSQEEEESSNQSGNGQAEVKQRSPNKNVRKKECKKDIYSTTGQAVVVNKNTELIQPYLERKLSFNMQKVVSTWEEKRLLKALEIFRFKKGRYFSLLEKIYLDDNNFLSSSSVDNINKGNTKFHNFEETFLNYSTEELDAIIAKSQERKFG